MKGITVFFSVAHHSYSRIDLFLVDRGILLKEKSSLINNITWSDHASVSLTIEDSLSSNTTYMRRTNTRILQLPEFKTEIEQCLNDYFTDNTPFVDNPFLLWNTHKAVIRGTFIKLGTRMKRQRLKRIDDLTKEIQVYESQNKMNPSSSKTQKCNYTRQEFCLLH